jgi:sporulation protein YlmC with PRC-barrel domain
MSMKPYLPASVACVAALLGAAFPPAEAQVAGTTSIGVASSDYEAVLVGWSARKQIIGHYVYNEDGEKVGQVEDLIVTPASAVSFAIVGAGGFVGVRRHHVAIPVSQLAPHAGDFVLPGASRAAIKGLPLFRYEE